MITRRDALLTGLSSAAALALARRTAHAQHQHSHDHADGASSPPPANAPAHGAHNAMGHENPPPPLAAPTPAERPTALRNGIASVITPNGSTLPSRVVNGVRVFHLVAEPVHHVVAPGLEIEAWGYNGGTPGPTIEAFEGERVRIYVTNRLPEPTTVHWHGLPLPNGMDGVGGLTQPVIRPNETMRYEFDLTRAGTFMYHPHFDGMVQMAMGLMGMFVVHPRVLRGPRVDRDFVLMLSEWKVLPGTHRPNVLAMNDFNVITLNSKAFPATSPLAVQRGERVRIRFGNLGAMDHHPIHLHGYSFEVTATDGGVVPASARRPETTVLVPVGTTRDIEFVADLPGDWLMHCHMTHHMMNQMGHDAPNTVGVQPGAIDASVRRVLPNYMTMGATGMGGMGAMAMPVPENSIPMMGGAGPFGRIDMGGMVTMLKVRERLTTESAAAFYEHPEGTRSRLATEDELRADGVEAGVTR